MYLCPNSKSPTGDNGTRQTQESEEEGTQSCPSEHSTPSPNPDETHILCRQHPFPEQQSVLTGQGSILSGPELLAPRTASHEGQLPGWTRQVQRPGGWARPAPQSHGARSFPTITYPFPVLPSKTLGPRDIRGQGARLQQLGHNYQW
jgi:hypothetical protein